MNGPRFDLSGKLVRISQDQISALQVGEFVLDQWDRNPTYLGVVREVFQARRSSPTMARVEWLKWYNESFSTTHVVSELVRLVPAS